MTGPRYPSPPPYYHGTRADLKAGDLIVALNGHTLTGMIDLPMTLTDFGPGDEILLTVQRDGEKREMLGVGE